MNLLIHDLTDAEFERIRENYKGWMVISDSGTIRPCIGCFNCWTGGKGKCVIKDGYGNMGALIHNAAQVVVMSRYTYGGFSSFVKNVFDRSLGYVLPEFETAYDEMHHKKRYPEDKPVTFIFRGSRISEEDQQKARSYVKAVCRNLRGSVKDVIFEECAAVEETEVPEKSDRERSGILLLDGSLRGVRSNTNVFLKKLKDLLQSPSELISLSAYPDDAKLIEAVSAAKTVILGLPLYVDGIPASALRIMEKITAAGAGRGCRLYAVVNNGLYESKQNENLLSMIKDWCLAGGIRYSGALAIGAGEVVGTLMRDAKTSLWPAHNAEMGLSDLAKAADEDIPMDEIYADPYLFPRSLYILIANTNWQRLKLSAQKKTKTKK